MRLYSEEQNIRQSIFDDAFFEDFFGRSIDENQTWGNWEGNSENRNEVESAEGVRARSGGREWRRSAGRSGGLPAQRSPGRSGGRSKRLSGGDSGGVRGER